MDRRPVPAARPFAFSAANSTIAAAPPYLTGFFGISEGIRRTFPRNAARFSWSSRGDCRWRVVEDSWQSPLNSRGGVVGQSLRTRGEVVEAQRSEISYRPLHPTGCVFTGDHAASPSPQPSTAWVTFQQTRRSSSVP